MCRIQHDKMGVGAASKDSEQDEGAEDDENAEPQGPELTFPEFCSLLNMEIGSVRLTMMLQSFKCISFACFLAP